MITTVFLLISLMGWWYLIRHRRLEGDKIGLELTVALIFLLIILSRPVVYWVHATSNDVADQDVAAGNPINRNVAIALMLFGIVILIRRRVNVGEWIKSNKFLVCLLGYCAISTIWSDIPLLSFKRWIRHLGPILFVLVVLTDRRGFQAVVTLVKYAAYILLPISIVLFKWYPTIGRHYHTHSGELMITGVTMHKNSLGMLCLISGLFLLFDIHREWSAGNRRTFGVKGNLCLLAVAVWLLWKCNSATATLAFLGGVTVYFALGWERVRVAASPKAFMVILLASLAITIALAASSNLFVSLVDLTGHSDTFWGRTELWKVAIGMMHNPVFGCGYDGFWLGERLDQMWDIYWWKPTEAHNGFVEVYLDLGFVGLLILINLIVQSYSRFYQLLSAEDEFARIKLALLVAILLYNIAEAAFLGLSPVWFMLLLVSTYLPSVRFSEFEYFPEPSQAMAE
jgi:exopolysaccharide production protein ExoQ